MRQLNRIHSRVPVLALVAASFLLPLSTMSPGRTATVDRYTITDLGTLGGPTSVANAINEQHQVVGTADTAAVGSSGRSINHAFIWDKGVMRDIHTDTTHTRSQAIAINDAGDVVGTVNTEALGVRAFVSRHAGDGSVMNVLPSAGDGVATGINKNGTISGYLPGDFGPGGGAGTWSFSGAWTPLPAFRDPRTGRVAQDSTDAEARGINGSGVVVGNTNVNVFGSYLFHAVRWTPTAADLVNSTFGSTSSKAWAINDNGSIVGDALTTAGQHAFLWSPTSPVMQDLGTLGGKHSSANGINNLGDVVGWSYLDSVNTHACMWKGGVILDLNTLLPSGSNWVLIQAAGINDFGEIVGYGKHNGQTRAFLLAKAPFAPDIAVSAVASEQTVCVGDPFTYTISVTNNGPDEAHNVVMTDELPNGLIYGDATSTAGSCAFVDRHVTCSVASLASGTTFEVTIYLIPATVAIPDGSPAIGPGDWLIRNTAKVDVDGTDPNPANNTATAELFVHNPTLVAGKDYRPFHQYGFDAGEPDIPQTFGFPEARQVDKCRIIDTTNPRQQLAPKLPLCRTTCFGCTLCSTASLLSSLPGLRTMTPKVLDDLLTGVNGYDGQPDRGSMLINYVQFAVWQATSIQVHMVTGGQPSKGGLDDYLNEHFCHRGERVLLQLSEFRDNNPEPATSHYIFVTGKVVQADGTVDWAVFDPGLNPDHVSPSGALDSLQAHWNGFTWTGGGAPQQRYYGLAGVQAFTETGQLGSWTPFSVNALSPVELLLRDPLMRSVGRAPGADVDAFAVPFASYFRSLPVGDDDGGEDPEGDMTPTKTINVPQALDGTYEVTATGQGPGTYTLLFNAVGNNGSRSETSVFGLTDQGYVATYTLDYMGLRAAPLSGPVHVVSFSDLLKEVTIARKLQLIDDDGIANSLEQKLTAWLHEDDGSGRGRSGVLRAFVHEVAAQLGKHIDRRTADLLMTDAAALMR